MDEAFITLEDETSVADWRQFDSEGMMIAKYLLTPVTTFDFHFLNYTQFGGHGSVNSGCGDIDYDWSFFTDREEMLLYKNDSDHE